VLRSLDPDSLLGGCKKSLDSTNLPLIFDGRSPSGKAPDFDSGIRRFEPYPASVSPPHLALPRCCPRRGPVFPPPHLALPRCCPRRGLFPPRQLSFGKIATPGKGVGYLPPLHLASPKCCVSPPHLASPRCCPLRGLVFPPRTWLRQDCCSLRGGRLRFRSAWSGFFIERCTVGGEFGLCCLPPSSSVFLLYPQLPSSIFPSQWTSDCLHGRFLFELRSGAFGYGE
jgi:hypothetical protein